MKRETISAIRRGSASLLLAVSIAGAVATPLPAAPITFNSALPVAEGEFIWREKLVARERTDDMAFPGRDVNVIGLANVLGYGVRGDLAVFGALPYLDNTLEVSTPMGRIERNASGPGDMRVFARYTALRRDARGETFRIAPSPVSSHQPAATMPGTNSGACPGRCKQARGLGCICRCGCDLSGAFGPVRRPAFPRDTSHA